MVSTGEPVAGSPAREVKFTDPGFSVDGMTFSAKNCPPGWKYAYLQTVSYGGYMQAPGLPPGLPKGLTKGLDTGFPFFGVAGSWRYGASSR